MARRNKVVEGEPKEHRKSVPGGKNSTDWEKIIWRFDWLDKAGPFAFDLCRTDFDHREILEKIIAYSNMTWTEVKRQTHDDGKSKHHLLETGTLSRDAVDRVYAKKLQEYEDSIFSFAFQNKLRIIGVRTGQMFHAVWFDPKHQFCPSHKR